MALAGDRDRRRNETKSSMVSDNFVGSCANVARSSAAHCQNHWEKSLALLSLQRNPKTRMPRGLAPSVGQKNHDGPLRPSLIKTPPACKLRRLRGGRKPVSGIKQLSIALLAGSMLMGGCLERELQPLNPCTRSGVSNVIRVDSVEKVDLLFMIDNSGSMQEEQQSLVAELPRMIQTLTSGDLDGDGEEDFPPVQSLQVGVITSDMGVGESIVPRCSMGLGDDGRLRTTGSDGCVPSGISSQGFLSFDPSGSVTPTAFADAVRCVAIAGIEGCGFEQQLEAVLKAVVPSTSGVSFYSGTLGHGDTNHAGFVRDDALLAMIVVTDEDDCSVANPDLYNPSSTTFSGELNLRCFLHGANPEVVHPVNRYVDGLAAAHDPRLTIFAAITGIPVDIAPGGSCSDGSTCPRGTACETVGGQSYCLAPGGSLVNFDAILEHPDMEEMPDPANASVLRPSCIAPEGRGKAFPGRRIVQTARGLTALGASGVVASICRSDFTGAATGIIQRIADALGNVCLPRALNRDTSGTVNCDVVETLPAGQDCTVRPGREFLRMDEDGRAVCQVTQLGVPAGETAPTGGDGWFYDDRSPDVLANCAETPQRIAFTDSAKPVSGADVRLECLQVVTDDSGSDAVAAVGSSCRDDASFCDSGNNVASILERFTAPNPLVCDPGTATCQPRCENNSQCPGGFVCTDTTPDDGNDLRLCVNPTCPL